MRAHPECGRADTCFVCSLLAFGFDCFAHFVPSTEQREAMHAFMYCQADEMDAAYLRMIDSGLPKWREDLPEHAAASALEDPPGVGFLNEIDRRS
ncbi:hypothetical protein [Falsiroseomonas sp. HW251]|uniref:hypothetical protein n=1 Tax=Falsiroseomonas sp. HW251 TaxID=3390998 RepID=UPI003D322842